MPGVAVDGGEPGLAQRRLREAAAQQADAAEGQGARGLGVVGRIATTIASRILQPEPAIAAAKMSGKGFERAASAEVVAASIRSAMPAISA